jgi:hypothetical protein
MGDDKNEVAVPPVDLIQPEPETFGTPAMASMPQVPPAHVTPPPFNAPAKAFMKQGYPVTQETTTRQTIYPGMPKMMDGVLPHMLESPGAPRKSKPCIEYLAALSQDSGSAEFSVEIHRTAPAIWNKQRLYYGMVERFPPAPYPEIYEQVKQVHGGGAYRLVVKNGEGSLVHQMVFNIDTLVCPPINNVPNGGLGHMSQNQMPTGMAAFNSIGGAELDDTVKLRNEEVRLRAEEAKMLTEDRVEQTRANLERQRERRLMGPQNEANKAVDTLRGELKDIQHQTDMRFAQMLASIDKTITAITQQPKDDKSLLLFTEMMKAQAQQQVQAQQQMTALFTAMIASGGNKGSELAEAMKMQNESNKQIVQMTIQSATAASAKSERLLEQMLVNKMEHPDTAVKQALEMRNDGWKQAMEIMEMMEERRGDHEREDPISPDSGFLGNLGNLFLHGLKNLVSGGAKGAGGQIMQTLAGMLNKPAGTTQFSEQELKVAADQMARDEMARRALAAGQGQRQNALPAPTQQALNPIMPPAPLPPQQRMTPMQRMFDRVYFVDDGVQAQQPVITPPPVMAPVPMAPPDLLEDASGGGEEAEIVETEEVARESSASIPATPLVEPAPAMAQVAPAPAQTQAATGEDEDLRGYVNEAIAMALSDIKSGRKEHDWVDFALGKWNHSFLVELVKAPDDSERIKLIQKYADPEMFQEMVQLLMDQSNNSLNYRNFIENMQGLLEEAGKEAVGA